MNIRLLLIAVLFSFLPTAAFAQFALVDDINTGANGSNPSGFTPFNGNLFFEAYLGAGFEEGDPHRYDGTNVIEVGTNSNVASDVNITEMFTFNGRLYANMQLNDGEHELFEYNAGADEFQLHTNLAGAEDGRPFVFMDPIEGGLLTWDGHLLMKANGAATGEEMYILRSDNNTIELLFETTAGVTDSDPNEVAVFGGQIFYEATVGGFDEPFRWDGTNAHQIDVQFKNPAASSNLTSQFVYDGQLWAVMTGTNGRELYKYNAVDDEYQQVQDLDPGAPGSFPRLTGPIGTPAAMWQGNLLMVASTAAVGEELFILNKATDQLELLFESYAGGDNFNPDNVAVFNNELFFEATDAAFKGEPARWDGTNVVFLTHDNDAGDDSNLTSQFEFDGNLYSVMESTLGREIFKYNIGTDNYDLLVDLNGAGDGFPLFQATMDGNLPIFEDDLFMSANGTGIGRELFSLQGTGGPPPNNPPVFTASGPFSVNEGSAAATVVGNVNANNGDGGGTDAGVTYSITAGNTSPDGDGNNAFSINAGSGVITVNDSGDLNFETTTSFTLTVQADDGEAADNTATASVTVNITDLAPSTPTDANGAANTVAENAANGTAVGVTASASDPAGGTVSYVLTNNAGGLFAINASTGVVTVAGGLDFETNTSHQIVVRADDANGTQSTTQSFTINVSNVNEAPSFAVLPGAKTVVEDGSVVLSSIIGNGVLLNDPDSNPNDLELTVTATSTVTLVTTGTAVITNNGTSLVTAVGTKDELNVALDGLTYEPSPDQDAGGSITFDVDDQGNTGSGTPQTAQAVVPITITPVNDAPVITSAATANVPENTTAVGMVAFTDPDAGDDHVFSITGGADAALFSVDASTGALAFLAAPDFESPADAGSNNVYNVQVTVADDGTGTLTDVIDMVVTVTDANDAPVITSAATASVVENSVAVMTVTATDPDTDGLTYSVTGGADAALFSVDASTGALVFDAAPDFEAAADAGADNVYDVEVTVTDDGAGSLTDAISIAVTVTNTNEDPSLVGLPTDVTVVEDVAGNVDLSASTFDDEDSAGNSVDLTLTVDAGTLAAASGGGVTATGSGTASIVLSGTQSAIDAYLNTAANITYTSAADANGDNAATLTLTGTDNGHVGPGGGGAIAFGSVNIDITAVNDEPSFTAGANQAVDEDSGDFSLAGWASAISPGPADEAGQTVTFGVSNNNNGLFATQPAISATGELTFTPAGDANGVATVTVSLSDNGGVANGGDDTFADQLFTITVNAVNDAPVLTVPGAQLTTEDTAVTFSAAGFNPITVVDVDAAASNLSVTLTATSTVDLSQTTGLTIGGGADGSDMVQFSGTLADINAALDGLIYTPSPNQVAGASLTIEVSDGGATGSGGALTDTETITINITSVNDIPDATEDLVTTDEDTAITIDVLANDSDPDGEALSVSIASPASNGTVQLNPDGTITYTPAADFSGEDRFDYTVTDGSGATDTEAVRITVTAVNDAPVAGDDAASLDQDTSVIIDVLSNDSDTESTVSVSAVGSPSNGTALDNGDGTITYTPADGYFGPDSFTYTITDGSDTAQATVTITVNSTNSAPVANADEALVYAGESVDINLLGNDTDADADELSLVSIAVPTLGTATDNGDGTMTYEANAGASGEDTFTYTVTDGFATTQGTVTVTIVSPGSDGDGVDDAIENGAPNDGDGNDDGIKDGEQDNVASLLIEAGPFAGQYVTVGTPVGNPLARVQSIENPSPGDFPAGASAPVGFLSYSFSNVEPGSVPVVTINFPVDAVVTSFLKYGPTPDNPTPHWYNFAFDGRTGAVVVPGRILIFFRDGERGDADLTENGTVVDPGGPVLLVDNPSLPVGVDDGATLDEDTSIDVDVLDNDSDEDDDVLSALLIGQPDHGTVSSDGGVFTYTPEANFFGEDSVTYLVYDQDGGAAEATVVFTVEPVQDAPVAGNDTATTTEDTPITFSLFANDFDVDGDVFWLTSQDDAQHGVSVYNDDGTVTYTPAPDFVGTDTWLYTINDGEEASNETVFGTITVTVTAVNDGPSFGEGPVVDLPEIVVLHPVEAEFLVLANPATDPEGDALTYRWEVASTSDFADVLVSLEGAVSAGHGGSVVATTTENELLAALASSGLTAGQSLGYHHRLVATDAHGQVTASSAQDITIEHAGSTANETGAEIPAEVFLSQNYPNPFNPSTTVEFGLPETAAVRLEVFDVTGRLVQVLINGTLPAGSHRHQLEMGNVPSGVYLYRLVVGGKSYTRTFQLVK